MKVTFDRFVFRSFQYIVAMNAIMFVLCAIFGNDFEPTWVGNAVLPIVCASASLWGKAERNKNLDKNHK